MRECSRLTTDGGKITKPATRKFGTWEATRTDFRPSSSEPQQVTLPSPHCCVCVHCATVMIAMAWRGLVELLRLTHCASAYTTIAPTVSQTPYDVPCSKANLSIFNQCSPVIHRRRPNPWRLSRNLSVWGLQEATESESRVRHTRGGSFPLTLQVTSVNVFPGLLNLIHRPYKKHMTHAHTREGVSHALKKAMCNRHASTVAFTTC